MDSFASGLAQTSILGGIAFPYFCFVVSLFRGVCLASEERSDDDLYKDKHTPHCHLRNKRVVWGKEKDVEF